MIAIFDNISHNYQVMLSAYLLANVMSRRSITLSNGRSFAFGAFMSIVNFLISAKMPLSLTESGKFPLYLPDTINGHPHERSGIQNGSNCKEHGEDIMSETVKKIQRDERIKTSSVEM